MLYTELESLIRQISGYPDLVVLCVALGETILVLESKLPRRYLEKILEKKKQFESVSQLPLPAPPRVWDLSAFCATLGEFLKSTLGEKKIWPNSVGIWREI